VKFDVDFHEDVEEGGEDLKVVEGEGLQGWGGRREEREGRARRVRTRV